MTLSDAEIRAVNLIEILQEDCEAEGIDIPPPPPSASTWSEKEIRRYFDNARTTKTTVSQEVFDLWFPGLVRSGTKVSSGLPKARVVCFPNAGNAEDMYTSEGTGVRKVSSPLLEWCRDNKVECLAPQYPGRAMRLKEPRITSAKGMAQALFPVLSPSLCDPSIPWILIAHSVGTWIAYEFLVLCRERGVPMPRQAFISAMPCPDIPFDARPWRQQKNLNEEEFKDECREWDISDIVFSPSMWPMYQPLLRADFTMFDEYEFSGDTTPFDVPIHAFWGTKDRRVKEDHVMGWSTLTSKTFQLHAIDGNHLWPLDKQSKVSWLQHIVDTIV